MRKKKDLSKIAKAIPMTVAAAALTSGMLFASAADPDGAEVVKFGETTVNIADMTAADKTALKQAFLAGDSIIVATAKDAEGNVTKQVEFGTNASSTIGLTDMWANPAQYAPDESDKY